jgi:hypothetical protein
VFEGVSSDCDVDRYVIIRKLLDFMAGRISVPDLSLNALGFRKAQHTLQEVTCTVQAPVVLLCRPQGFLCLVLQSTRVSESTASDVPQLPLCCGYCPPVTRGRGCT